jgi:hypothetical protein
MIEGSGRIRTSDKWSGSGSRRPKNIRVRRIRIRNTEPAGNLHLLHGPFSNNAAHISTGGGGGGVNGNEEFIKSELVIAGGKQLGGPGHKGQYFGQCGTPPKPPPTTRRVKIDREPRSRLPRRNFNQLPLST